MKFRMLSKDEFFLWFAALIVLVFFVAGLLDILNNMIVKLVLFTGISFLVANISYILFKEDKKKSPEKNSE